MLAMIPIILKKLILSIKLIRIKNIKKRSNMNQYILLVTVPNIEEGKKIGKFLVESKLAACVNIIHNIISIFRWKGEIEEDNEHLLLIKTIEENNELIIQKINELHSYEIPECIGFKIKIGSQKYLNWITEVVK